MCACRLHSKRSEREDIRRGSHGGQGIKEGIDGAMRPPMEVSKREEHLPWWSSPSIGWGGEAVDDLLHKVEAVLDDHLPLEGVEKLHPEVPGKKLPRRPLIGEDGGGEWRGEMGRDAGGHDFHPPRKF